MYRRMVAFAAALAATALPAFGQSGTATTRTMPACSPGDAVVWENTKTKAYHLQGDAYFGTTKHGKYACKSAADAAGYHAAGTHAAGNAPHGASNATHGGMNGSGTVVPAPLETAAAPDGSASEAPATSKHHRRHKHMASPEPTTASPLPQTTR